MLERTPETFTEAEPAGSDETAPLRKSGWKERLVDLLRQGWHLFVRISFSSLTRRIIFLNVTGLLALVIGIFWLSHFRAGLIDARKDSLLVQGEIIAIAIANSATMESEYKASIDPERLLDLQAGESYGPADEFGLEFPISPERVAPLLRRFVTPTNTRARLYDRDGQSILDSRNFYDVLRFDLPPPTQKGSFLDRAYRAIVTWVSRGSLPLYQELPPQNGKGYGEVARALRGYKSSELRINERGEVIVSVAVPVQRTSGPVRGALMLSTQGTDIDAILAAERVAVFKLFLIASGVMVVLSILLAGTIAGPVRRLAEAAQLVRGRSRSRVEIPDLSHRRDEIGHLSGSLRAMTEALYSRIEAIETFAADVAHELKNPLTSLRSAVETLPLARSEESRARLLAVIQHDVKRLDRLISDISAASRLDAEMQRHEAEPVDTAKLLATIVGVASEPHDDGVAVKLNVLPARSGAYMVMGQDTRLGQVVDNLVANARSFSPPGGSVRVTCRRVKKQVEIIVDDDGPGIPTEAMQRIFERFYTHRPQQAFGQNSGLGLSISKEIIEAHGGRVWAENRQSATVPGLPPKVLGARFVVRLPAM